MLSTHTDPVQADQPKVGPIDDLIATGRLTLEPNATVDLRGGQVLTLLQIRLAAGVAEPRHTQPGTVVRPPACA